MTSFQIAISPTRRAAARFISSVRRAILQALAEEARKRGLTQAEIARELKIHRSVINRELRGESDISVGRIGELAYVLGRKPTFALLERRVAAGANVDIAPTVSVSTTGTAGYVKVPQPEVVTMVA